MTSPSPMFFQWHGALFVFCFIMYASPSARASRPLFTAAFAAPLCVFSCPRHSSCRKMSVDDYRSPFSAVSLLQGTASRRSPLTAPLYFSPPELDSLYPTTVPNSDTGAIPAVVLADTMWAVAGVVALGVTLVLIGLAAYLFYRVRKYRAERAADHRAVGVRVDDDLFELGELEPPIEDGDSVLVSSSEDVN